MRKTAPQPKNFEIIARTVITSGGKVLLCRKKNALWYFLPGGHVEFGESVEQALAREAREEFNARLKEWKFIGAVDNIFMENGKLHDELNLVFAATINRQSIKSRENHLEFVWLSNINLKKEVILPPVMKKCLLKWLKDKKPFFTNQTRN